MRKIYEGDDTDDEVEQELREVEEANYEEPGDAGSGASRTEFSPDVTGTDDGATNDEVLRRKARERMEKIEFAKREVQRK